MSARHPRFLEHFFIEQHFQRFLTPQFNRPGPWYYFLGVETIGLLPWTPLVFAALVIAARNWKRMEPGQQALLVWVLLVFGFFSASRSKLPTYILPLFPQQCVLAAGLLTRLSSGKEKQPWLDSLHRALGIVLCASLPVAYFFFAHRPPSLPVTAPMLLAVVAAVLGMAAGWIFPKFLPWSAFLLTECLLIGAQAAEPWLSARDLARTVQTRCPMDATIIAYDVYLHGLPFYTGRKVDQLVNWVGEFDYVKADPRFAPMFGDDNTIRNLERGHRLACVILQRREKAYFGSLVRSENLVFVGSAAGPWTLALVGLPAR
jgi:hypothetical protein